MISCLILFLPAWNAIGQTPDKFLPEKEEDSWGITKLMESLSKVGEGTARFKEERHINFLSKPLTARGNLRFKSPDFLFKHTESPKDERLVVFADEVTITNLNDGFQRTFSLNDYPQLRGLLDAIRFTLAGNLVGLNKSYKADLLGAQDLWQLNLTPKPQPILKLIQYIKIFGRQNQISKIETEESNGDHTVMLIEPHNQ